MTIENYLFYILVASLTIASPGPGVVLSISNSIKYGMRYSVLGILGIALGMLSIAVLAATGLGAIAQASETVFIALKYVGASYLIYLGVKLWRSEGSKITSDESQSEKHLMPNYLKKFNEGLLITLLNPKPMVFFIALFPQFIHINESYTFQVTLLSLTFCILVCIIHSCYAIFARNIDRWFSAGNGHQIINKASSLFFFSFAILLAFE